MIGVYAGSFDPFHNGHMEVLEQAIKMFDKIYILICKNSNKKRMFSEEEMYEAIQRAVEERCFENVHVIIDDRLTVKVCESLSQEEHFKIGSDVKIIRGLRNSIDLEYEKSLQTANYILNHNINPVYFINQYETNLSSSIIRELINYGQKEITQHYLPRRVWEII